MSGEPATHAMELFGTNVGGGVFCDSVICCTPGGVSIARRFGGRRGRIDQAFITLPGMTLVVVVVAAVVAVATYLTWLARRLDRLGVRVDAARAGLLTQLVARATAAGAQRIVGRNDCSSFTSRGDLS